MRPILYALRAYIAGVMVILLPAAGRAADLIVQPPNDVTLGGVQTYDNVVVQDGASIFVAPYDGTPNTGYLVLRANSITVQPSGRITAKGAGYRTLACRNGESPLSTPAAGGRGGCGVYDSAGGGGHIGDGGPSTKDGYLGSPAYTFPTSFEEDCVGSVSSNTCVSTSNCRNNDGMPSTAGESYPNSIYDTEFGAAGGDKGCRDGFDPVVRGGNGGGRLVLFAANAGQTGTLDIQGAVTAAGKRGCAGGNDAGGGGAGGSLLLVSDHVIIGNSALVSAAGGRGGDAQPKCLPCTSNGGCQSGQTCVAGRCSPCNCTSCTSNADCDAGLGQTCKNLGGDLGNVCANALNQCTPVHARYEEQECQASQNSGTCDDCGGGGGGGILHIQSRALASIGSQATVTADGGLGGVCGWCTYETAATDGESVLNEAYAGEVCDGYDNDFNGVIDDTPDLDCNGHSLPSCIAAVAQQCPQADVSITKTLMTAGPYTVGQTLTYELLVANAGPATADSVQVTDTPSNLNITGVTGCVALPCTISSLASGANQTISITAVIAGAGNFNNQADASAGGAEVDPNPANNVDDTGNGDVAAALPGGCAALPSSTTCKAASKHAVSLKSSAPKSKFAWKWSAGVELATAGDFGNPVDGSPTYRLCVYDQTATAASLKIGVSIPGGGTCGDKPCWKDASGKGWSYKDKAGSHGGITGIAFKTGDAGKPSIQVKGSGVNLALPSPFSGSEFFDADPSVVIELHSSNPAQCWSSTFPVAAAKKNLVDQFKAKLP